jgi:hypothetical protein
MKIVLWEYMSWRIAQGTNANEILVKLNELGGLGWELVLVREGSTRRGDLIQKYLLFIMKRPSGQSDINMVV